MQNSRLVQVLQTLSKKELDQLEAYLAFVHKKGDNYNLSLLREFRKHAPHYQHAALNKLALLDRWPTEQKGWTSKQLSYQASELTEHTEQFLLWQQFQRDKWQQSLQLYLIGFDRQLPFLQRKGQKRIEKWLQQYPYRDSEYYRRLLHWQLLQHEHAPRDHREPYPFLQGASDSLDRYFALQKTRFLWEMINVEAMLSFTYNKGIGEPLQKWLSEEPSTLSSEMNVRIYQLAVRLLTNYEDTDPYYQLKELLLQPEVLLPAAELRDLFTGLLNFCTRRLNQYADETFRREFFTLNQHLLAKGWLLEEGVLSHWRYINLVTIGLALQEEKWVGDFIETYQSLLTDTMKENAYHYVKGLYHYHTRNFDAAQRALARVSFEEPFFNAGVRLLLVRIYYDADETDLLFHQLEANRLFLLRDSTITTKQKEQIQQFQHFLRRLSKLLPNDRAGRQTLRAELPSAEQILFRQWLLDRL